MIAATAGTALAGFGALAVLALTQSWVASGIIVLGAVALQALWASGRAGREATVRRQLAAAGDVLDFHAEAARSVRTIAGEVQDLPERITVAMGEVKAGSDAQEEAVEETASLLANINTSVQGITERVERLSRAADDSSSSILQMGSAVEEVARSTATLHESVEGATSSVHEMSASIRQVAGSAEQVERMAEETAASMVEMDRAVQEVGDHVREASSLTEKVTTGAEEGSQAVTATIEDIEGIRALTLEARQGLEKLVSRIAQIADILNVIGDINDETNLLSLNAAIIAAQAGEQGKAFLVVANHVKTLAQRTAKSTKDIALLIQTVRDESDAAVDAMGAGIGAIEKGVERSKVAGDALSVIRSLAHEANTRVAEIARAADEQGRSSKLVAQAAQETSSQVRQITAAMTEQTRASDQLLQNAESALAMCRQVHRSTDEQRETGRYITESISSITDMIRLIQENIAIHARASESVSEAVVRLLENARRSGKQTPQIHLMTTELRESAQRILGELGHFEPTLPDAAGREEPSELSA